MLSCYLYTWGMTARSFTPKECSFGLFISLLAAHACNSSTLPAACSAPSRAALCSSMPVCKHSWTHIHMYHPFLPPFPFCHAWLALCSSVPCASCLPAAAWLPACLLCGNMAHATQHAFCGIHAACACCYCLPMSWHVLPRLSFCSLAVPYACAVATPLSLSFCFFFFPHACLPYLPGNSFSPSLCLLVPLPSVTPAICILCLTYFPS